jgi:hypothetical protein
LDCLRSKEEKQDLRHKHELRRALLNSNYFESNQRYEIWMKAFSAGGTFVVGGLVLAVFMTIPAYSEDTVDTNRSSEFEFQLVNVLDEQVSEELESDFIDKQVLKTENNKAIPFEVGDTEEVVQVIPADYLFQIFDPVVDLAVSR